MTQDFDTMGWDFIPPRPEGCGRPKVEWRAAFERVRDKLKNRQCGNSYYICNILNRQHGDLLAAPSIARWVEAHVICEWDDRRTYNGWFYATNASRLSHNYPPRGLTHYGRLVWVNSILEEIAAQERELATDPSINTRRDQLDGAQEDDDAQA